MHGRLASRRRGGAVSGYIAAEEAELWRESEQRAREQARLRRRFGVGALGDLTEEEAMRYAQIVSEESYLQDEQRRASDSAADASLDSASSRGGSTADTATSEPPQPEPLTDDDDESEFEQQVQQAIRLSLLEGVDDVGRSPRTNNPGELEYAIPYKPRGRAGKPTQQSASSSLSASPRPATHPTGRRAPRTTTWPSPSASACSTATATRARRSRRRVPRARSTPPPTTSRPSTPTASPGANSRAGGEYATPVERINPILELGCTWLGLFTPIIVVLVSRDAFCLLRDWIG